MQWRIRVLIVEDSEEDTFLLVRRLEQDCFQVQAKQVGTAEEMKAALDAGPWDLIISDYSMPQFSGPDALALYREIGLDIPFILVSGVIGEHIAVDMLKAGAHYYVKKDQLERLAPAVRAELKAADERRRRKHPQNKSNYLASLVESCDEAIIGLTLDGKVVSWNDGAERLYGRDAESMIGGPISVILPAYRPQDLLDRLPETARSDRVEEFETVHMGKGRSPLEVLVKLSPVRNPQQKVIGASAVVKDITRRKIEDAERLALIKDLSAALEKMNEIVLNVKR